MTINNLLAELTAQITQNGIKVSTTDRTLGAATRFTPEQVTNAVRQKLLVSGYKITGNVAVKSNPANVNQFIVTGAGINNLVVTFDYNTGAVTLPTQVVPQPQPVAQPAPVQQPVAQ
jgi:hypothetical protein